MFRQTGADWSLLQVFKSFAKCGSVPQRLFGGGICPILAQAGEFKEAVGGCHDVFNLRTGLRFQERKCVDKHAGIGDEISGLFKLG